MTKELAEQILKDYKKEYKTDNVRYSLKDNRKDKDYLDRWVKADKPRHLLFDDANIAVWGKYIGFHEVGYGALLCYDSYIRAFIGGGSYTGVFEEDFCMLGDYHGYAPKPVFFTRMTR